MQKAIWMIISTLRTTATSSMSAESASHADIRLFDCSMANGHMVPVKTAATTATAMTAAGFPKLCLRMKLKAMSIIRTITTDSMSLLLPRLPASCPDKYYQKDKYSRSSSRNYYIVENPCTHAR